MTELGSDESLFYEESQSRFILLSCDFERSDLTHRCFEAVSEYGLHKTAGRGVVIWQVPDKRYLAGRELGVQGIGIGDLLPRFPEFDIRK